MIKHTHTCAHTHKHTHARTRTLAQVASLGLSDPIFFCAASAHRSRPPALRTQPHSTPRGWRALGLQRGKSPPADGLVR